jgi:hypothetical protein
MRYMGCMGDKRSSYRILVRKHDEKTLFGRLKYRWELGIKIDLEEIAWKNVH